MASFTQRFVGAASLRAAAYEDVEADRTALPQALVTVLLSSLAAGIGARGFGAGGLVGLLFFSGLALVGWLAWAMLTYQIGAKFLPEKETRADLGELLRTIGFSSAPGVLRIFGVIGGATFWVFLLTAVWMLAAMIVAVRQALAYSTTRRALVVCGLGWLLAGAFALVLGIFFGPRLS